jgi:uncharacterized membrane protein
MKKKNVLKMIVVTIFMVAFLAAGTPGWTQECTATTEFWFWRLGHMDGPHDSSMALGISRDGKVAVGETDVVDFIHAWRCDIDWAVCTDDQVPPLFNELQVQEDLGVVAPSQPSAAYSASDMTVDNCSYDKENNFDWCGSLPVGGLSIGEVSYGVEWFQDDADLTTYVGIPDFGGGISDMKVKDVSIDGTILVGYGTIKRGPVAFRADTTIVDADGVPIAQQLTITDSVYTEQTLQTTVAEAVSEDGLIIAGYGSTKRGNRAFVTTVVDATTDPITLESVVLPNIDGGSSAEAYAMTPDGAIIAGRSDSPKGPQACIWFVDGTTGEWVVKGLGGLSKQKYDSVATGVAYKLGSTAGDLMVVGKSESILYDSEAFVWTGNPVVEDDDIGYLYDLEYILIKTGVAEASSMGSQWILNEATGISAAGDRIVGWGTNPEGGIEAWLVTGFPFDVPEFTHE